MFIASAPVIDLLRLIVTTIPNNVSLIKINLKHLHGQYKVRERFVAFSSPNSGTKWRDTKCWSTAFVFIFYRTVFIDIFNWNFIIIVLSCRYVQRGKPREN